MLRKVSELTAVFNISIYWHADGMNTVLLNIMMKSNHISTRIRYDHDDNKYIT